MCGDPPANGQMGRDGGERRRTDEKRGQRSAGQCTAMKSAKALDGYREAEEREGSTKTPQENGFMILINKM